MNRKIYIPVAFTLLLTAGCVDLNYHEATSQDEQWVYENPLNGVRGMVWDVYAQMFNEFDLVRNDAWEGALKASTTDEAEFATSLSDIHKYYNGGWTPSNPFPATWSTAYRAIAEIHTYLEKIDKIDLSDYQHESNYADIIRQFEIFPHELRFLRAYFYFELARAYGDVPLVTTTLTNAQANSVKRTPVKEVFAFIVDECDAVAEYLPVTYLTTPEQEIGRATRAAALGLKARTLLYAASPLFNTSGDKELWKRAAAASKDLIDRASGWGITLGAYGSLWGWNAFYNKEMIIGLGQAESNDFEKYNYPVGVEGGNSGNCPSQSLVDMYEYQDNGETFKQRHPGNVNITTENPYDGLDPRFALTIVRNGDRWPSNSVQSQAIETYVDGFNGLPKYGGTPTGYYLRKFVDGGCVTTYNAATTSRHTWIDMRLSEFYLNYAEAMYNYYGDADTQGEFGMSANEAVNVLRNRADIMMPNFEGSDGWEERYMRERMVEFAFEGHRFWDVRRWKKGAQFFKTISVATLQRSGDEIILNRGTKNRLWDEKYNLYPIPQSERQKNSELDQNSGW